MKAANKGASVEPKEVNFSGGLSGGKTTGVVRVSGRVESNKLKQLDKL